MFMNNPGFITTSIRSAILAVVLLFALAAAAQSTLPQQLGYPAGARLLIIQTDLGMMHAINRAGFEALERKLVTSATVLMPCPWFPEAAAFARAHPDGDYGLHLVLNSEWTPYRWRPLLGGATVPSLVDADGYFPSTEEAVVRRARPEEVERELRAQIEAALHAGVPVTHLDTHMGTLFASPALFDVYRKLGREYRLPLLVPRDLAEKNKLATSGLVVIERDLQMRPGVPYDRWLEEYKRMLASLPPGVYQLTVHLGYDDEEHRGATAGHDNWGAHWRQNDWDVVRSGQLQQWLRKQGFTLITWKELGRISNFELRMGYL